MSCTDKIEKHDLSPLCRALAECGVGADEIPSTARRLVRPPLSLGQTAAGDPEIGTGAFRLYELAKKNRTFDGDTAARLLRLHEGRPDPHAKWKTLSLAERKRARRLWTWIGETHGLSITPQGRSPVIDPALVLYCTRVLCEASGRPQFTFSRPADGGTPRGPMWRVLIEALPIAQRFLALRFRTPVIACSEINSHAESVAEIVKRSRSKHFKDWCQKLDLGPEADNVAGNPSTFRLAIAYARKSRQRPHRP
jgi:hypothetical protein